MLLMAAAMAAGVVTTMAQGTVYSLNIVGYVNRVCQGTNLYTLVANPLTALIRAATTTATSFKLCRLTQRY